MAEMNALVRKRMNDEKKKIEMKYIIIDKIFSILDTFLNPNIPTLVDEPSKDDFHVRAFHYNVRVRYENERFHITINAINDNKITGELIMFLTGEKANYIIGDDKKIHRCFDEIGNLMNTITDVEDKNHEELV